MKIRQTINQQEETMFVMNSHSMKRALIIVFTLLVLAALTVPAFASAPTGAKGIILTTDMTGKEEAPGPGDPDGFGKALFRLDVEKSEVCWILKVVNIAPATAAHIHLAPAGSPGPVVVPLSPPTDGKSTGCATVDKAIVMAIAENPGAYYVNVHNADYPAGAVRGQLGD
jgi:hypothetical protein